MLRLRDVLKPAKVEPKLDTIQKMKRRASKTGSEIELSMERRASWVFDSADTPEEDIG